MLLIDANASRENELLKELLELLLEGWKLKFEGKNASYAIKM